MEDRIRELLRERAEDVPPALWDMPARAQRRAHRRAAFTMGVTALTVVALVVGTLLGVRQLTAAPPRVPARPSPSLVPVTHHNGEIVVFRSGGLFGIDPATGIRHKLLGCPPQTDGQTCNVRYDEAWSPSGTKLAYAVTRVVSSGNGNSGTPANGELGTYVLDPSTGRSRKILPCGPAACGDNGIFLDWSPDGSRIAVTEGGRIYVVDPDGTHRTTLIDAGASGTGWDGLAWSPDGTRIAFSADGNLYTADSDGAHRADLLHRETALGGKTGSGALEPAWSPDGSRIAYVALVDSPDTARGTKGWYTGQIWVMDADGSHRTKLFEQGPCCGFAGRPGGPVWSPDGTKLVFTLGDERHTPAYHLYVMNADGSDVKILFGGSVGPAAWQPVP
jgi:Tol biopolymer transport system component